MVFSVFSVVFNVFYHWTHDAKINVEHIEKSCIISSKFNVWKWDIQCVFYELNFMLQYIEKNGRNHWIERRVDRIFQCMYFLQCSFPTCTALCFQTTVTHYTGAVVMTPPSASKSAVRWFERDYIKTHQQNPFPHLFHFPSLKAHDWVVCSTF